MIESEQSVLKHIAALRTMLIRCLIAVVCLLLITGYFAKELYNLLATPLQKILPEGSHFIATHPVEAWYTYFMTAIYTAVFLATPIFFFEFWRFIAPALHQNEKKKFLSISFLTSVFFIAGGTFGYFVAFPLGLNYFTEILSGTDILFMPRMEDYLGFAFRMLIAFGIIFETPLVIILLAMLGLISRQALASFRRYYILLAFILAAFLTPPDVISQTMMGIPLILLYEVGYFGTWILEKKQNRVNSTNR